MQGGDFFLDVLARARAPITQFQGTLQGSPNLDAPPLTMNSDLYSQNAGAMSSAFRMPQFNINQSLDRALNPSKYDPGTGRPISQGQRIADATKPQPTTPGYLPQGGSQQEFLSSAVALAARALSDAGLPTELAPIMAGIAANETGYGNPKYTHGNNYFGIKGGNGPLLNTWEVRNGRTVNEQASFRDYVSPLDSFRGFIDFLRQNPRYQAALSQADNPEAFIRGVHQAGYATDPNWSTKVLNIANTARTIAPNQGAVDGGFQLQQGQWPAQPLTGTSQYDLGLPREIADAFCGPAAVMEFMKANGRTPDVNETLNLAKRFGWNQNIGAAGPQSIVNMLNSIGIMSYSGPVDPNKIAQEVQAGRPVMIDTPGHYYQVTGANPDGTFTFGDAVGRRRGANTINGISGWGFGAPRTAIFLAGQ